MTTEQKQVVNDLWDLWEKLAEHGEIYIGKNFCKTYDLLKEQVKSINYNQCSLQLKDKETVTFEDWLYKHQIKKIDRLYFAKDGTEQDFNALHRRYVESLINL